MCKSVAESPEREKARKDPHHVGISGLIWSRKSWLLGALAATTRPGPIFSLRRRGPQSEAELYRIVVSFGRQAQRCEPGSIIWESRQVV
jgi:hypothetical protein